MEPGAHSNLAQRLASSRESYCFPLNLRQDADQWIQGVLGALFPHFSNLPSCSPAEMEAMLAGLEANLAQLLARMRNRYPEADPSVAGPLFIRLPDIHAALDDDARAIFEGDPAARNVDEVILTYPGFYAIAVYRLAHALHALGAPILPRLFTEHAHRLTGIDIHPGATIGRSFFIDHGTGIVIGETTTIGDRVKVYQGVTLGALAVHKHLENVKRHPTIEDDVVIYAHATILGGDTVIGRHSVIGGNAWITDSVAPYSVVTNRASVRVRDQAALDDVLDWSI